MSVPLYSLRITAVGEYVEYSLRELRLILFSMPFPTILRVIALYTRPAN